MPTNPERSVFIRTLMTRVNMLLANVISVGKNIMGVTPTTSPSGYGKCCALPYIADRGVRTLYIALCGVSGRRCHSCDVDRCKEKTPEACKGCPKQGG
jgi:hypothetical protein